MKRSLRTLEREVGEERAEIARNRQGVLCLVNSPLMNNTGMLSSSAKAAKPQNIKSTETNPLNCYVLSEPACH